MTSIHDQKYQSLINHLVYVRKSMNYTQETLAAALGWDQSVISKVETLDRRIDIIELYYWLNGIGYDLKTFLEEVGIIGGQINTSVPAVPVRGGAISFAHGQSRGTVIKMLWQGEQKDVFIENLPLHLYNEVAANISTLYQGLNKGNLKNREAIFKALKYAIDLLPQVNPSDIYHHIVYRLYLRDYNKTQADRSWVRAGGEAFELFLQEHYNKYLIAHGVKLIWLKTDAAKKSALQEMRIDSEVGGSKLDIGLYGWRNGVWHIFGGIHAKASLAERVSDDIPCSQKMMSKGFVSYLVTFDAKSFPPPNGDLVNRGELGSPVNPSDKRKYIEEHGDFSACFSYNLRTVPSGVSTPSGKKIFVSTFDLRTDQLMPMILSAWESFQEINF